MGDIVQQTRRDHLRLLAGVGFAGVAGRAFAADAILAMAGFTQAQLGRIRIAGSVPALSAAWSAGGAAPHALADGLRSVDSAARVTTGDLWHIGSNTKSMTATLVARLVEAGGIGWDTTVAEVLGSAIPTMREEYKSVTFRHLCSHRAGLTHTTPIEGFPTISGAKLHADRLRLATMALGEAPIGKPGEKFLYANSGFVIAGAMLETVYKTSWETLLRRHLFAPLGMRSAGFGPPGHAGKLDQPLGHGLVDGKLVPATLGDPAHPADLPEIYGPAGLVHIALADWLLYLQAHASRSSLLKAENWSILHTPPFGGDYAMGWVVRPDGTIWHNGSNLKWYAECNVDMKRGHVACVASNCTPDKSKPAVAAVLASAMSAT